MSTCPVGWGFPGPQTPPKVAWETVQQPGGSLACTGEDTWSRCSQFLREAGELKPSTSLQLSPLKSVPPPER
jgi:hypothetical protein